MSNTKAFNEVFLSLVDKFSINVIKYIHRPDDYVFENGNELIVELIDHGGTQLTAEFVPVSGILFVNLEGFGSETFDSLDRYSRGLKGSEGFPSCYHYVDTSGGYRKYTDHVVIHPENEEDFGYRFRVNPDCSMHVARFDVEEGLIVDKKEMVNIYSNLLSDLLHHVFSRKKIYV